MLSRISWPWPPFWLAIVMSLLASAAAPRAQTRSDAEAQGSIVTVQAAPDPANLLGWAAQSCEKAAGDLAALRSSLSVSLPDGLKAQAEGLFPVVWKIGAPVTGPAYLVIATEDSIRARSVEIPDQDTNSGMYVLTPAASAPFRFQQFLQQTRIIIPLHVANAPTSGSLLVRPLLAGRLTLSVAIVGVTKCGESQDVSPLSYALSVDLGSPEIVIADRFDLAKPDRVIASPNGTRRIEVFGNRFHLVDLSTGTLLADEVGDDPAFSPTGRFVLAHETNRYDAFDAIDGRLISKGTDLFPDALGNDWLWDDHDSFSIAEQAGSNSLLSGMIVVRNLLDESSLLFVLANCTQESHPLESGTFRIDLENNVAVSDCKLARTAARTEGRIISLTIPYPLQAMFGPPIYPFSKPTSWEMIESLKATQLGRYEPAFRSRLSPFIVAPLLADSAPPQAATAKDPFVKASHASYDLSPEQREAHQEKLLSGFGLEVNSGPHVTEVPPDTLFRAGTERGAVELVSDPAIRVVSVPTRLGRTTDSTQFWYSRCGELAKPSPEQTEILVTKSFKLSPKRISTFDFSLTLINGSCELPGSKLSFGFSYLLDSRAPGHLVDLSKGLRLTGFNNCGTKNFFACDVEGQLFRDRYLVLWSRAGLTAGIYDLQADRWYWQAYNLPRWDVLHRLSLSADGNELLKLDRDGSFQVFQIPQILIARVAAEPQVTHDVLLSGRIVDDEVVVWTSAGLFDSTTEGATHVAIRFPGRVGEYTLAQFESEFHIRNLFKRLAAGEVLRPPQIRHFPPQISVRLDATEQEATGTVNVLGDEAVQEIRVFQNGLLTDTLTPAGDPKAVRFTVTRQPGARWLAFLARGASGAYSQPVTIDAGLNAISAHRLHVISVGVSKYVDKRIDQLRFAASDAARFARQIQERIGPRPEIASESVLLEETASPKAVLSAIEHTVETAGANDTIILFFAGHGVQAEDKQYYLATASTQVDDIAHTSLAWRDIEQLLGKARSRVVIFLDSCHGGSAATEFFASNDQSAAALLDQRRYGGLRFSASKGRETSQESEQDRGGVFTSAVIDALSSRDTDLNRDGEIEASELYAAVKRTVVEKTNGQQTPWFARNEMVGDLVPF